MRTHTFFGTFGVRVLHDRVASFIDRRELSLRELHRPGVFAMHEDHLTQRHRRQSRVELHAQRVMEVHAEVGALEEVHVEGRDGQARAGGEVLRVLRKRIDETVGLGASAHERRWRHRDGVREGTAAARQRLEQHAVVRAAGAAAHEVLGEDCSRRLLVRGVSQPLRENALKFVKLAGRGLEVGQGDGTWKAAHKRTEAWKQ